LDEQTRTQLADLLDALANGDSIQLGEFGDNSGGPDPAGEQALWLRERADELRAGY
jgi:hypothetical protein